MNNKDETEWWREKLRERRAIIERQMNERAARALAKGFQPCKNLPEDQCDRREIWEIDQLLPKDRLTRKDWDDLNERADQYTRLIAPWGLDEWWRARGKT